MVAILQWAEPKTIEQLRGFMGLSGYYRRFIHNYATIASPLTNILKKNSFSWTIIAQTAFSKLKEAIATASVLSLPNLTQTFVLETDASGSGIGNVLHQNNHPIAYFSKKLTPMMQK